MGGGLDVLQHGPIGIPSGRDIADRLGRAAEGEIGEGVRGVEGHVDVRPHLVAGAELELRPDIGKHPVGAVHVVADHDLAAAGPGVERGSRGIGELQDAVADIGLAGVGIGAGEREPSRAPLLEIEASALLGDSARKDAAAGVAPDAETRVAGQDGAACEVGAVVDAHRPELARALEPAVAGQVDKVRERAGGVTAERPVQEQLAGALDADDAGAEGLRVRDVETHLRLGHRGAGEARTGVVQVIAADARATGAGELHPAGAAEGVFDRFVAAVAVECDERSAGDRDVAEDVTRRAGGVADAQRGVVADDRLSREGVVVLQRDEAGAFDDEGAGAADHAGQGLGRGTGEAEGRAGGDGDGAGQRPGVELRGREHREGARADRQRSAETMVDRGIEGESPRSDLGDAADEVGDRAREGGGRVVLSDHQGRERRVGIAGAGHRAGTREITDPILGKVPQVERGPGGDLHVHLVVGGGIVPAPAEIDPALPHVDQGPRRKGPGVGVVGAEAEGRAALLDDRAAAGPVDPGAAGPEPSLRSGEVSVRPPARPAGGSRVEFEDRATGDVHRRGLGCSARDLEGAGEDVGATGIGVVAGERDRAVRAIDQEIAARAADRARQGLRAARLVAQGRPIAEADGPGIGAAAKITARKNLQVARAHRDRTTQEGGPGQGQSATATFAEAASCGRRATAEGEATRG